MRKFFLVYLLFSCVGIHGQNVNTNCLDFDGVNDYVNFTTMQYFSAMTVEFWVKVPSTQANANYSVASPQWWEGRGIVDNEISGYDDHDWGISLVGGNKIAFGIGGYSVWPIVNDRTIISSNTINDDNWHHVAATWENTNKSMFLYIDGVQVASGYSVSNGLRTTTAAPRLGCIKTGVNASNNSYSAYFKGQIDELRFWNVVRSQTQINDYMNKQINGSFGGQIPASYHFNQGSPGGANQAVTTLEVDPACASAYGNLPLTGFALTGTTSNWVSASLTLPVTWLSFTAQKQGEKSLLTWSTASEQNTKDFEVQHSTNTLSWTPLGTLPAAGNSTTTRQYSFTHSTPFKGNLYNYYRILQRDLDGKFSYSKIASLIYDEPGPDVFVYPNPATEAVTVYLAESQDVRLINVAGATVWRGTLAAGRNQIPLTNLAKGVYWVVIGSVKKQLLIQ